MLTDGMLALAIVPKTNIEKEGWLLHQARWCLKLTARLLEFDLNIT